MIGTKRELHTRSDFETEKCEIFFLFLNENICCDYSLEPSRRDGSDEGHNICLNGEIWKIVPNFSLLAFLILSTAEYMNICRLRRQYAY